MAVAGELKTLVTADTTQFAAGLTRATAQAQQFSGQLVQRLRAASSGIEDFAVVMGQGGANSLGRALMAASNNISQFGMTMGPWGAIIGGGAAVLASTLLPKLLQTSEGVDHLTEALKNSRSAWDTFFDQAERMQEVGTEIGRIDTTKGILSAIDDAGQKLGQLQARLKPEQENLRVLVKALNREGKIIDTTMGGFEPGKPIAFDAVFDESGKLAKRFGIAGADAHKAFMEQSRNVFDIQEKIQVQSERLNQARQKEPGIRDAEAQAEQLKTIHHWQEQVNKLFEDSETPLEKTRTKLAQIVALYADAKFDDAAFDRFTGKLLTDFKKSLPDRSVSRDTPALFRDTMPAAQAILAATRSSSADPQNKQVQQLQQLIELGKAEARTLRNIEQNTEEQPETVAIPP